MNPTFDERDAAILAEREALWNKRTGPRVGDFVRMKDGTLRRFTHDWGNDIQTTYKWSDPHMNKSCNGSDPSIACGGSFHLTENGNGSFSGSLDDAIPKSNLLETSETRKGLFWFFHHNHWCAHNGVYFDIDCRVFRQV